MLIKNKHNIEVSVNKAGKHIYVHMAGVTVQFTETEAFHFYMAIKKLAEQR